MEKEIVAFNYNELDNKLGPREKGTIYKCILNTEKGEVKFTFDPSKGHTLREVVDKAYDEKIGFQNWENAETTKILNEYISKKIDSLKVCFSIEEIMELIYLTSHFENLPINNSLVSEIAEILRGAGYKEIAPEELLDDRQLGWQVISAEVPKATIAQGKDAVSKCLIENYLRRLSLDERRLSIIKRLINKNKDLIFGNPDLLKAILITFSEEIANRKSTLIKAMNDSSVTITSSSKNGCMPGTFKFINADGKEVAYSEGTFLPPEKQFQ